MYRAGVGLLILNSNNEPFIWKRIYNSSYFQMPQGGIDEAVDFKKDVYQKVMDSFAKYTDK